MFAGLDTRYVMSNTFVLNSSPVCCVTNGNLALFTTKNCTRAKNSVFVCANALLTRVAFSSNLKCMATALSRVDMRWIDAICHRHRRSCFLFVFLQKSPRIKTLSKAFGAIKTQQKSCHGLKQPSDRCQRSGTGMNVVQQSTQSAPVCCLIDNFINSDSIPFAKSLEKLKLLKAETLSLVNLDRCPWITANSVSLLSKLAAFLKISTEKRFSALIKVRQLKCKHKQTRINASCTFIPTERLCHLMRRHKLRR